MSDFSMNGTRTLRTRRGAQEQEWSIRFDPNATKYTRFYQIDLGSDLDRRLRVVRKRPYEHNQRAIAQLYTEAHFGSWLHTCYGGRWMEYPSQLAEYLGQGEDPDEDPDMFLLWDSRGRPLSMLVPLPPDQREVFAKDLLIGLAYLSAAGVVHRDLKPDNVLWDGQHCQIIDFSAAARTGQARAVVDAPQWCSPEQRSGEGQTDPLDDVYSAGWLIAYAACATRAQVSRPHDEEARTALSGQLREVWKQAVSDLRTPRPSAAELLETLGVEDPTATMETQYSEVASYNQGLKRYDDLVKDKQAAAVQAPALDVRQRSMLRVLQIVGGGLLVLVVLYLLGQ